MSQPLTLRTDSGDEHIDFQEFEARVRRGEVAPQSLVRFPAVTGEVFVPACTLETYKALHQPRQAYFSRVFSLGRFPYLTTFFILVNVGVYLRTVSDGPVDIDAMVRWGGKVGPLVRDVGQVWRLFTANFLHRDGLHIGLNLFVLLNVGRVLENAYRTLDVLGLFLFSAVFSMSTSLWMADAVSVGASGMVYGGLGGVVAFGLKYRALLPSRYQRLMSEAALPIVLGLLLIGIVPWGGGGQVDNWAHAGGLVAGFFYGVFLRPKLLVEPATTFWSRTLHAFPSGLLVLGIVLGEPMLEGRMPALRLEKNDELGVQLLVPPHWRQGAHVMGQWAFYNGLPGLGRATVAIEVLESDHAELSAQRFFDESLTPPRLGDDVLSVFRKPPVPVRVASLPAQRVEARFETRTDTTELWAYFVSKGSLTYQCVFTFPARYPRYEAVVRKLVDSIAFEETRELRQARSRALLFPNSAWALGSLGESLRRHGEGKAAIAALRQALRVKEGLPQVQTQLALALLQNGDIEEGCAASTRAVSLSPLSVEALESLARCEVSRGAPHVALTHIQAALSLAPGDERLKEVAARLRAAMEQAPSSAPGAPRKD